MQYMGQDEDEKQLSNGSAISLRLKHSVLSITIIWIVHKAYNKTLFLH